MKGLSSFQAIILMVFVVFVAGGVAVFALYRGGERVEVGPGVTIWGILDAGIMRNFIRHLDETAYPGLSGAIYIEKDPRTYIEELINALASREGPDLFLVNQEDVLLNSDKILAIPYINFSERLFKDTFIEGGELLLAPNGILAFPFTVDPLIMYWNRDIFASEGFAGPPRYWDEFFAVSERISRADNARKVLRSAVALGEYTNITHAKEIIATLAMQAGTPIVARNKNGELYSAFDDKADSDVEVPAEAALRFYTEFANPVQSVYSWNRSLPSSRQAFLAGDLAIYFGFASELTELKLTNPNLNFDVAEMPQTRSEAGRAMTYGNMLAFAIPRATNNAAGALAVVQALTASDSVLTFGDYTGLPPVRRDLLATPASDAYSSVFYRMALISRGWLDPNPAKTSEIFKQMVESITSGREKIRNAVKTASRGISNILDSNF